MRQFGAGRGACLVSPALLSRLPSDALSYARGHRPPRPSPRLVARLIGAVAVRGVWDGLAEVAVGEAGELVEVDAVAPKSPVRRVGLQLV